MVEDTRINYCDKDGQCTATCGEEMGACRYYVPLKTMCPGMCTHLSKLGDHCLSPVALVEKLKEMNKAKGERSTAEGEREAI